MKPTPYEQVMELYERFLKEGSVKERNNMGVVAALLTYTALVMQD